jgi:hypothetical protein
MLKAAVVILSVLAADSAFAQSLPNGRASAGFATLRRAGDPYRQLFTAPPAMKPSAAESTSTRKMVCGMTMIEGDASIDPKMAKAFPKKDGSEYTIRSLEPPTCNPAR